MPETNKTASIALRIIEQTKKDICRELPSFIRAIESISYTEENCNCIDGCTFFFEPADICRKYTKSNSEVTRLVLHSLLHCMFLHIWSTNFKNKKLWDLACDICVEKIINDLNIHCSKTEKSDVESKVIADLSQEIKSFTAENIYYYLLDEKADNPRIDIYKELFYADNHNIWYKNALYSAEDDDDTIEVEARSIYKMQDDRQGQYQENGEKLSDVANSHSDFQNQWKETTNQILRDSALFAGQYGISSGNGLQILKSVTQEKFNYADLLASFLQENEALEINDDEFDYIYYTYGLRLYDNIPLIEPLEYIENNKLIKLIIAIDTSGSVKGPLVEGFIKKTCSILKATDFFKKDFEIHIIQCDNEIKDIAVIKSQRELEAYMSNITLHGFGGTDFTPVFNYADNIFDNLTNKKHFNGIIYFTDGDGKYPEKTPSYKNAFIIHDNGFDKSRLPVWATPLYIDKNDLRER
ncbi:MAG: hypothetical protein IJ025_06325 [Clostridia bacterium]|nr:hypothetical protein [Clostridia bacterium]